MEILILGAGLVGSALADLAGSRAVLATSRDADIRDAGQVGALVGRHQPAWVVLSAAISNVDRCQREPDLARAVNVLGAENVARAARDAGARLLYLSTDYVFDGAAAAPYEVDAPRRPISVYGQTKADGEDVVRNILPGCAIARTSWVFGSQRECFATLILRQAVAAGTLNVESDKFTCPTYNRDLAGMLLALIDQGAGGVFHCCNAGIASRLQLAEELLRAAGMAGVVLERVSMAEMNWPAPRPPFSAMSVASVERMGIHPRLWRAAVPDFVDELRRRGMLPERSTAP